MEQIFFKSFLLITDLFYNHIFMQIPGPPYNPIFGNVREAMVGQAMDSSVG